MDRTEKAKQYLVNHMVSPSRFILLTRPNLAISNVAILDNLEYIEEEICSKGGLDNMDPGIAFEIECQIIALLNEQALRN